MAQCRFGVFPRKRYTGQSQEGDSDIPEKSLGFLHLLQTVIMNQNVLACKEYGGDLGVNQVTHILEKCRDEQFTATFA